MDTSNRCKLRASGEFFMTLMRLKLRLVIKDLAFRFAVSRSTCARVFQKWVNIMYINLKCLTCWPARHQVDNTMPADFKERFPKTRVVIDCTELLTESPHSLAQRSMMWSQYKIHMTWKALFGITPNRWCHLFQTFGQVQSVTNKLSSGLEYLRCVKKVML